MRGARRLPGGALAVLLCALPVAAAAAEHTVAIGPLTLGYEQVQEVRFDQDRFDYDFTGRLTNDGTDAFREAYVLVTSTVDTSEVLEGQLVFGGAQPGDTARTSDVFTLRVDRTVPFDPAALAFAVSLVRAGDDPHDHPLVQGDDPALELLDKVGAALPAAELEVLGKRKYTDPVTGNAYTVVKLRVDGLAGTAWINDASRTGAFGLDFSRIERDQLLAALPPVYAKMSTGLLAAVRAAQGGTLGGAAGGTTPIRVVFRAETATDLDAIEAALGSTPRERLDSQQILEDDPGPIDSPPPGYGPASVQVRGIVAEPPLADILTVGALPVVSALDLELAAELFLDASVPRIRADLVQGFGVQGAGVQVAVVDSGIDGSHPNLSPRVVANQDFTEATPVCDTRLSGMPQVACDCPGSFCESSGTCTGGSNAGAACTVVCPSEGRCIEPWDDAHGHGTHVGGIAGSDHLTYTGVAPRISLLNAKSIRPGGGISRGEMGMAWGVAVGADVLNGSYGAHSSCRAERTTEDGETFRPPCLTDADCADVEGDTCRRIESDASSGGSRQADLLVYRENRTIVFAAGNDGASEVGDGRIPSTPADAYNGITVGGSFDPAPVPEGAVPPMFFSTKGPTTDGRSKPDVTAPGFALRRTRHIRSTSHTWEALDDFGYPIGEFDERMGTSMAAPHVAGLAAMLFGFGQEHGLLTDTPYLKAAILNTARRLHGWRRPSVVQPLDPGQGTGEVDAREAFAAYAEDDRVWQKELRQNGEVHWYTLDLPFVGPGAEDIVLTLVWERQAVDFDPPPISDLNLYLYDPSGHEVDRSISDVDNVEHIVYPAPAPGRYCVRVEAERIQGESELYALAGSPVKLGFMDGRFPCIPDYGDAPDPDYPTRQASDGARHLDWTKEWLGWGKFVLPGEVDKPTRTPRGAVFPVPSVSGEDDANDPEDQDGMINLVNRDLFDDGVLLPSRWLPNVAGTVTVFLECKVNELGYGPAGRYQASDPEKRLYLNAWADWNGDGVWDESEKIIGSDSPTGTVAIDPETFGPNGEYTLGDPFQDENGSGRWEPGEPFTDLAGRTFTLQEFQVTPPAFIAPTMYLRFRLDYGQDIATPDGPAAFGEVEDYSNEAEIDSYPDAILRTEVFADGQTFQTEVQGPFLMQANLGSIATVGPGVDALQFEFVDAFMTGSDPLLGNIVVRVRSHALPPFQRSRGEIRENLNFYSGLLDMPPFLLDPPGLGGTAVVDAYFEVEFPDLGLLLHTPFPLSFFADIGEKPAAIGDVYQGFSFVPLVDDEGVQIASLSAAFLIPRPCGNGLVDGAEECDDGNVEDGDGCSSTCQLETSAQFGGTAQGALVQLEIDGVLLTFAAVAGSSGEQVAAQAALAASSDAGLQAAGVTAAAHGNRLVTTGEIGMLEILEAAQGPAAVPALGSGGRALLIALLALAAAFFGKRRSGKAG